MLALLYGAGLRISEALGIKRVDAPVGDIEVITVLGKGRKMRQVPTIEPIRRAVERYLSLCPHPLAPDGPLFIGLLVGVILILGGLQYLPALALGPVAEHLTMLAGKSY